MTVNYNDLLAFSQQNASDPQTLAKVLTAWSWTSWSAFSYGVVADAGNVENLDTTLYGACGFRSLLMQSLFESIGVHTRQVSLFDVAVQGGHVATELQIGGKWMYFDATFGVYFESASGGAPLSLEEIRAQWPNVVMKQATAPGWTGIRADLQTIDAAQAFQTQDSHFFDDPSLATDGADIAAELSTMLLGGDVRYWENGVWTPLSDATATRATIERDSDNLHDWLYRQTIRDANGALDIVFTQYDNQDAKFEDYDNFAQFDWLKQTTLTQENSFINRRITAFDDGSTQITFNNPLGYTRFASVTVSFDADGAIQSASMKADGATTYLAGSQFAVVHGRQLIYAASGDSYVIAGEGNDTIVAGAGLTIMRGLAGDDLYYVHDAASVVWEEEGGGLDTIIAASDYELPLYVENLYLTGSALRGTGNSLNNAIVGNEQANSLSGRDGNDTLHGYGGADTLIGGAGADMLFGGDGGDQLYDGLGNDTFYGGAGADTIVISSDSGVAYGDDGNDWIYGGAQADTLAGGNGVDVLNGGGGADVLFGDSDFNYLFGGDGNDTIYGSSAILATDVNVMFGEQGEDVLIGGAGANYFYGGPGADSLYGGAGLNIFIASGEANGDVIFGGAGQNYVYGSNGGDTITGGASVDVFLCGAGADIIAGGGGTDYAWGGAGADTFIMDAAKGGVMVIQDFTPGSGDVLTFASSSLASYDALVMAEFYSPGLNTTIITDAAGNAVWLIGVAPEQLNASMFAFW